MCLMCPSQNNIMASIAPLVFVFRGKRLPWYAHAALRMAVRSSRLPVVLLSDCRDSSLPKAVRQVIVSEFYEPAVFGSASKAVELDAEFWDGFWYKTIERFFVLRDWMLAEGAQRLFHAELDNLVFDLSGLAVRLDESGRGLFIPRSSEDRALASLIYVNNPMALNAFCDFVGKESRTLIDNQLLARFVTAFPEFGVSLPTESFFSTVGSEVPLPWKVLSATRAGGIFDAAAVGQWLFGVDPRLQKWFLRNRFRNEELRVDVSEMRFVWNEGDARLFCTFGDSPPVNLYNLHVHSKMFAKLERPRFFRATLSAANANVPMVLDTNITHMIRSTLPRLTPRRLSAFLYRKLAAR